MANPEAKLQLAQIQVDQINSLMMRRIVRTWGQDDIDYSLIKKIDTIVRVIREVDAHVQKEGSTDGLKVEIGTSWLIENQNFYIIGSLIEDLIDERVTPEQTGDRNLNVWPSAVKGLAITREKDGENFRYFLVKSDEKQFNWFEAARNA